MFRNLLAFLVTAILLVVGIAFSVVAFAILAVLGAVAGIWVWWRTRPLRREMDARFSSQDDRVIEGEAVVVEEFREATVRDLPEETPRR